MFGITVILLIISIILYLHWFFKKAVIRFKQRDIPYVEPRLIFGNIIESAFFKKSLSDIYIEIYRKLEPHKVVGVFHFHKPTIMIRDPELLKEILIKSFAHFPDRGFAPQSDEEPLTNQLVNIRGELWKNLRIKLTPTFSTGKMKMMFPLMKACGDDLTEFLDKLDPNDDIETKDLCARFTTDVIGTCVLGFKTNTIQNPESEFLKIGREITKNRLQGLIRLLVPKMSPTMIKLFNLRFFQKEIDEFFFPLIQDTIKYREENKVVRYDFLDLLIGLKNHTDVNKFQDEHDEEDLKKLLDEIGNKYNKSNIEMTNEILVANAFLFFFAGFETSSTALGFLLIELALNPHIQDKLRTEITTVLENNENELTYEVMKKMKYADMVISEILRKHPPAGFLQRRCEQNYRIPNTNILIKENETLTIPVHALHMDEKYYEKPNEFYPEHFTEEAVASRPQFSYLPFGEGPRMCIATRFAKMEIKIALIYFLRDFSYRVSPKMSLPIKYAAHSLLLTSKDGLWVNCIKI